MKYKINLRACASVLALQVAVAGVMSSEVSASDPLTEMFLIGTLRCTPKVAQYVATAKTVEELSERAQEATILRTQPEDLQQAYIEERKANPQVAREQIIENITGGDAIRQFLENNDLDLQDNALRSAARITKGFGVDLNLNAVALVNAAKDLISAQAGRNPTKLSQITAWRNAGNDENVKQSIIYLCSLDLEADEDNIDSTTMYLREHINPTREQIEALVQAGMLERPSIIHMVKINVNEFTPENIDATTKLLANHIEPTADQIHAAKMLIAAGIANPTEAQISAWLDADVYDRNVVIALAKINLDFNEDRLAAINAFTGVGHNNPTAEQIVDWEIGNPVQRQAMIYLVQLGVEDFMDYVDATQVALAVIDAPNKNQIDAANAFTAAGKVDPTAVQINAWVEADPADRNVVIALAKMSHAINNDAIEALTAFNDEGIIPTGVQVDAWVNAGAPDRNAVLTLAKINHAINVDTIEAANAFIAEGKNNPTTDQINAWMAAEDADRPEIVAASAQAGA